jgi:hypothetical protein
MKKCHLCKKNEGKIYICNLCASTFACFELQKNHPEFYREDITSLFEDRFIPQLEHIQEELERLRLELRIKKVKRKI